MLRFVQYSPTLQDLPFSSSTVIWSPYIYVPVLRIQIRLDWHRFAKPDQELYPIQSEKLDPDQIQKADSDPHQS
jgi:hypothetical protein